MADHFGISNVCKSTISSMSGPRKRRENHNEIEKKRRDQQRLRLEELRESIPRLQAERPSAVNIIMEAINYIRELNERVTQLDAFIVGMGKVPPAQVQRYVTVPDQPHTMPGDVLFSYLQTKNPLAYGMQADKGFNAGRAGSGDENTNLFDPDQYQYQATGQALRRDSAMLLPTKDPKTFLFGKRDSIQNLFTGSMPAIFHENAMADIQCSTCYRGVDNLIMIDCDGCHHWYHIRCVGIESHSIPLQWKCVKCMSPPLVEITQA
ncbi:hypothetical protein PSACC_01775 [Paramicrosporidium saccamoebae]|uniref:PHD-type domain-containing protein n=1 Tax=Paramicrosporidium saccamoebae TaxID=1246581 RepID=A0A2H9TKY6_9FUNG|nr:hypothetical protein PSACC_01775 [Paramicrosporidium saccamoebae]